MADIQIYLVLLTALNICLMSNGQYVGKPQSSSEILAVLKHSVDLRCEYTGSDGPGGFIDWYKNGNESVGLEKPGHYVVKHTDRESILHIKIFVQADSEVQTWSAKTNKPGYEYPQACQFGPIPLKSSPQGITGDRKHEELDTAHGSLRRVEGESVKLKCIIKPEQSNLKEHNTIQWHFRKDGGTFDPIPDGVHLESENQISIDRVNKAHRGYYRCTLNDVSFTVFLRVKDRLAPLWPFIGIVSVVVLLVIVILIFEKRQKSMKNVTANDDTNANDPLVRSSDNETKKRVIKS